MIWTGFIWFRIETSGAVLWTRYWSLAFHEKRWIPWLLASQEELCSVELVHILCWVDFQELTQFHLNCRTQIDPVTWLLSTIVYNCLTVCTKVKVISRVGQLGMHFRTHLLYNAVILNSKPLFGGCLKRSKRLNVFQQLIISWRVSTWPLSKLNVTTSGDL
jgi:hypothetical protein